MIIDKGHFEIIIAGQDNCFDVYIYNKELNCSELYDDDMTETEVNKYLEEFTTATDGGDLCDSCGKRVVDENFHWVMESRGEFWGAPCSENICVGYECNHCGHKEEF